MKEGEVFKFIISQPSRVEVGALSKWKEKKNENDVSIFGWNIVLKKKKKNLMNKKNVFRQRKIYKLLA